MKQTAWMNMQPRKPSKADERFIPIAIEMLSYIGVLNYALLDLEEELIQQGLFKFSKKKAIKQAQSLVTSVHSEAYQMLAKIDKAACRQYNDRVDTTFTQIQGQILLDGIEKPYNITIALCRLIEKLNKKLERRYNFAPARVLYRIPALLSIIGAHDYNIDNIIEL